MHQNILGADAVRRALSIRDLTDPEQGPHAMQIVLARVQQRLERAWRCASIVARAHPIVSIEDNYDRLHYPEGGAARDARYTRYVSETMLLRTHTTAIVPPVLRALAAKPVEDVILVCPGLVYRRDCIDRLHTGQPHQVDLWRLRRGGPLDRRDLEAMAAEVVDAALPGRRHRTTRTAHPYTIDGLEIEVLDGDRWVEIGECGLALPALLRECGHDTECISGLAMGIGLDRVVMLAKGLDDIRLLRSEDPRISVQMADLEPYRPVSSQPPVRRDLSIAVAAVTTSEELGDRVREALGDASPCVEAIEVMSETPAAELPAPAIERLGMRGDQKNVLLRVVLRDLTRTLTHDEANQLRDRIYAALHEGSRYAWAAGPPARCG